LKSTVTENLGFAIPIAALKPLLEKPNPVPMARWLTIGALDAEKWTTLFGANWRQRAGRIQVKGLGQGFGGRSLCLSQEQPTEFPLEVTVAVRLDQEDGAAGLVFHSDGNNKHYGFYPSNGQMRLSRFDGPDVYAWQVLAEKKSDHYKPGEWNWLKVHLEKDRFLCYINDELVFESSDAVYTNGRIGLAKFRHTEAEFKGFRTAKELPPSRPTDEVAAKLMETIGMLPIKRPPPRELVERLPDDPLSQALVLEEQAKLMEQRAKRLRELSREIQLHHVHRELKAEMSKPEADIDLLKAALWLARLDNPELDIDSYLAEVDRMARDITTKFNNDTTETQKIEALNHYLFEQQGYHGSRTDYYNRSNSYLNEVLDDREGLPITLSVLYMEMARRLNLNVVGVGLPGHFVTRFEPKEGDPQLIDVFEGGKFFSKDEAAVRVLQQTGRPINEEDLAAQTKLAIITRMLRNLMSVARDASDAEGMLRYVDTLVELNPDIGQERWFRAVLQFQTKRIEEALLDTNWLLEHQPEGVNLDQVRELQTILEADARAE
ncbi:MAG: transglutaminase family protein, partial [Planctomycetaceae bacterium]